MTSFSNNSKRSIPMTSAAKPLDTVDPSALKPIEQTLTTYGDAVLRLTFSYVHDLHDAEEILQDILVQYIKHNPKLESAAEVKTWLLRTGISNSKTKLKERMYHPEHHWPRYIIDPYIAEELAFVWDAVSQLPPKYSEVVHLYYCEGYSIADIARLLDKHSSSIHTRLSRARVHMKKFLGEVYDFDQQEQTAYSQLLHHIRITPEMEERMMKGIQQELQQHNKLINIKPYYIYKRQRIALISLASCAVCAMCTTLLMAFPSTSSNYKGPAGFQAVSVYPVMSYSSLTDLNNNLSFALRIPTAVAEAYTLRFKYILFDQAVSLTYSDDNTRIEYKMIKDDLDITGDLNHYTDIIHLRGRNGEAITLKGDTGLYRLGVWTDGIYTYSIKCSTLVTKEMYLRWIESTKLYNEPQIDQ